jgi:ParB-like chromosome segregation protein Spo0J
MTNLQIVMTPVDKLRPTNRNPRTHSNRQIQQIADSIRQFGWTSPIVVDESGKIIAGHGRFAASLDLRLRRVPTIVVSGLSDVEKRALALADNKIAANAGWDRSTLAAELGELATLLPEISSISPLRASTQPKSTHWRPISSILSVNLQKKYRMFPMQSQSPT